MKMIKSVFSSVFLTFYIFLNKLIIIMINKTTNAFVLL